jgi:hypothetical protein
MNKFVFSVARVLLLLLFLVASIAAQEKWSEQQARDWYAKQ